MWKKKDHICDCMHVTEEVNDAAGTEEKAVDEAEPHQKILYKRYYGECNRSGGERKREHALDFENKKKDSHKKRHLDEDHLVVTLKISSLE